MAKIISSKSGKTKYRVVNGEKFRIRNKTTGRNYRKEYDNYQGKPSKIKQRTRRNAARAKLANAGKVRKGDGKDVAHKDNNTKNKKRSNLSVQSKTKNRSFARTKRAGRKKSGRKKA